MPTPGRGPTHLWRKLLLGGAATVALLAVFGMYTQPDFMVLMADRIWSCF